MFDPNVISYKQILLKFFSSHCPESECWSHQYRSAILYHNEEQREIAETTKEEYRTQIGVKKIFTDIEPATPFYRAEEYHQKFLEKQIRKNERFYGTCG